MEFPDGEQWTYQYDYNGLRTEREYSYMGEMLRYEYKWVDGKLAEELRYNDELTAYITLKFYYDGEELIGFNYNGDNYYYGKTNNGEIRFIYDANGNIVTTYHYDAWGTPLTPTGTLADTVGAVNPFRYKSYYYDSETRLYYLQSRYYDPQVGRFLNADSTDYLGATGTLLSYNLFAYCENNPTMYFDLNGESAIVIFGVTIGVKAALELIGVVIVAASISIMTACFLDKWFKMCNDLYRSVREDLFRIRWITARAVSLFSKKAKSIAEAIGESFSKTKNKPNYRTPEEEHHLVAKKAHNAKYAADILWEVLPYGVENSMNKLYIKTGLHRRLHTNAYYGWANSVVISAYKAAGEDRIKKKQNVYLALNVIKAFVKKLDEAAPY